MLINETQAWEPGDTSLTLTSANASCVSLGKPNFLSFGSTHSWSTHLCSGRLLYNQYLNVKTANHPLNPGTPVNTQIPQLYPTSTASRPLGTRPPDHVRPAHSACTLYLGLVWGLGAAAEEPPRLCCYGSAGSFASNLKIMILLEVASPGTAASAPGCVSAGGPWLRTRTG